MIDWMNIGAEIGDFAKGWPFTSVGYSGDVWTIVFKFLLVGVIFVLVLAILRFLFGPGGPMRDSWIDEANAKAAAEREAAKKAKEEAAAMDAAHSDSEKE